MEARLLPGCPPSTASDLRFHCWVKPDAAPDALPGGTRMVWRADCGRGEVWRKYQMTYDLSEDKPERRLVATYADAVDGKAAKRMYPRLLGAMAAVAARMQRDASEEAA